MWDLPGPGLEPTSPALAGGFLTTVPPGKPHELDFVPSLACGVVGGARDLEPGPPKLTTGKLWGNALPL